MRKSCTIQLDSVDLGQLLDGLELRAESWERTAEYLRSGYIEVDFIVEECHKPEEADDIAAHPAPGFASKWTRSVVPAKQDL